MDNTAAPRQPAPINRIILLVLDCLHSGVALQRFVDAYGDRIICVASSEKMWGVAGEGLLKIAIKYFRRSGIGYLLYLTMNQLLFKPCAHVATIVCNVTGRKQRAFTLSQTCKKRRGKIVHVPDINSSDFVRYIDGLKPDLILLLYFDQILQGPLIAVPKYGVLNIHPGILPDNRGPDPSFWAARMQHEYIGATAHFVDGPQIDAGPVFATRSMKRNPHQSVIGIACESMRMGAELAIEAVIRLENGTAVSTPQDNVRGKYYPVPTRNDVGQLWKQGGRLFRFSDFIDQLVCSRNAGDQPRRGT